MPLAVRFDEYGDVDVLKVVEVARPVPGPAEVLVKVAAAGINPGEASIRKGLLHAMWTVEAINQLRPLRNCARLQRLRVRVEGTPTAV